MNYLRVATFFFAVSLGSVQAASNPVWYNTGLGRTNHSYYKVGGDRVKFGWRMAPGCDLQSLRNTALTVRNAPTSFAWDDNWYAIGVSSGRCMVFGWYDLTTNRFGWAAVQNKPSSWGARSNASNWVDLGNGDKKKYSFTINGQTVDLDIFNPYNQGILTGNDILFGFGY